MRSSYRTCGQCSLPVKKGITIAIDGPAASGKSTAACLLAKKLGYLYLDTGAMYRALTWKALRDKVDIKNGRVLSRLARKIRISLESGSTSKTRVYINEKDVTSLIRSPQVNKYVSLVSSLREVREEMVAQQRKIGERGGIVAEGRDMGTVVFSEAEVKIFLTASLEERTRRRWKEEGELPLKREKVKIQLANRDRMDSQREISPLKRARGAILIDNTHLNISQTLEKIWKIVKRKINQP